jgi:Kdo2-lipid IVA lauroyltransferase/acyltransferase
VPGAGLRLQAFLARSREAAIDATLRCLERVLPRLPTDVALLFADVLATIGYWLDRRGRSAGKQNLEAVFGDSKTPRERARILRASYRNAVRVEMLLFHLQPLTPARFARWVSVSAEDTAMLRRYAAEGWRGVMVGAHQGNWELLLGARTGLPFSPTFAYLAESSGSRALDASIERLRDRGGGGASLRKRGALALRRALAEGKCVSFLMDRNVRGEHGGDYVPFLGLPARTTPLGAVLAHAYGVPMVVALMTPEGPRRWRLRMVEDVMSVRTGDARADIKRALTRANEIFSEAIRAHPETWLWTLKRFKSRPTEELGRYPAYSFYDPGR